MASSEHAVVIAGGGPTGLMLAAELALAGVDVAIIERRRDQHVDGSRAGGLHARTIEVLDQRGVADRFLSAGQIMQVQGFALIPIDISDFPSRHPYGLALWQSRFEPILADWVADLGVPIVRGVDVVGAIQDDAGVSVDVSDGTAIRAAYLVGCDGGRSVIRKSAAIEFVGREPSTSWLVAEVEMDEPPPFGMLRDEAGTHALNGIGEAGLVRLVVTERELGSGEPTLDELRAGLRSVYGTDGGLRRANWLSRFTDAVRQADCYRSGRLLVAGDAAHVHPPHGGQGLNIGVQDAVNLGWKLAQVVDGVSPDSLLDTYHAERHPVAAGVLESTLAMVALNAGGDPVGALRTTFAELLAMDEPRRLLGGRLSGLDIRYATCVGDRESHPLVGRRMPDLDVQTVAGPARVFELLHAARPVLLCLDGDGDGAPATRASRVVVADARYDGAWELPVVGRVEPPPAVLIRPDGYVAWAGQLADPGLQRAIATWFGGSLRG